MTPKISVLMPVYNAAPYLREAIDSILGQTYADFEFIIVNDGSTDASESIVDSYTDLRIKHIKRKVNEGLVHALNMGIDLAQGEYIARMDADDISLPERFEKQLQFMERHPEAGACGTAYRYIGDRSGVATFPDDFLKSFTYLSSNSSLAHPTSMIRRAILEKHSIRYEQDYAYAEDYAFWIRIGQVAALSSLPESLLLYRWHSANISRATLTQAVARTNARILWHELLLGKVLSIAQKRYLNSYEVDWEAFRAGRNLVNEVLQSPRIDQKYFGLLAATEWEIKIIDQWGLRGLIACFSQPTLRSKSQATVVGLVAQYFKKFGIKLK